MKNPNYLGATKGSSITVPLDQLGSPGISAHLIVKAQFTDDRYHGKDRIIDQTPRTFGIKTKLLRHPASQNDLRGDMSPEDGASLLFLAPGKSHLEMGVGDEAIRFETNQNRQLSIASSSIIANNAHDARNRFSSTLSACFDRLSYVHSIPIFVGLTVVHDIVNEVQYLYYQSPPRDTVISDQGEILHIDMQPIYALYREFQNSPSPYYRVLCLYKIMEGLLGPLRISVQKRAKLKGISLQTPKALVPNHPDIPGGLRSHIGSPIKAFFDTFLSKQYRDAVAHFELTNRTALNVSTLQDSERFHAVAFLADICARLLIERHEGSLAQLL